MRRSLAKLDLLVLGGLMGLHFNRSLLGYKVQGALRTMQMQGLERVAI